MKKIFLILISAMCLQLHAQNHSLHKIWETSAIVPTPESVLPDAKNHILYISLINGGAWNADGVGGIGKLDENGKKFDSTWITGLNAPKGLGKSGNRMYAADISQVVVIDIKKGVVEKKIPIEGAAALNDITVDNKGIVYVSDSRTSKIWRIENDVPTLYLDNMKGVNGLKSIGDDLYIGAGKDFLKADKNKNITKIAETTEGIDGIEPTGNGDFILTSWVGYIYYVTKEGKVETMLESHEQKINAADIGFDQQKKILYVPTFNTNTVVAYKLQ